MYFTPTFLYMIIAFACYGVVMNGAAIRAPWLTGGLAAKDGHASAIAPRRTDGMLSATVADLAEGIDAVSLIGRSEPPVLRTITSARPK